MLEPKRIKSSPPRGRSPLRLLLALTALLSLALACGGGDKKPEKSAPSSDQAPSLGELLTVEPSSGASAPASKAPVPPVAPPAPPSAASASSADASETEACTKARTELKARRKEVDALRASAIQPEEQNMQSSQQVYTACVTNPANCGADAKKILEMKERSDAAVSRYQATLRRIAESEAGLFPFEQAVDRNCGRN